jgi:hypothetical protein
MVKTPFTMPAGCVVVALLTLGLASTTGSVATGAQPPSGPGGMQLQPGYLHTRTPSLDTIRGRVWKDGGPEIVYDIGLLALNEASLVSHE